MSLDIAINANTIPLNMNEINTVMNFKEESVHCQFFVMLEFFMENC